MAKTAKNTATVGRDEAKKRYRAYKELRIWFACALVICIGLSVYAGIKHAETNKGLVYSSADEAQSLVYGLYDGDAKKGSINDDERFSMAKSGVSRDLVALYGEKYNISAMDLSYLFYSEFYTMVADKNFRIDGYGTYGLNPKEPLKGQMYTELRSFFDELMNTASAGALTTLQYYELAKKNGLALEDEDNKKVNEELEMLKAEAKNEGMELNDYLDYRYCPGMTEADALHILELYQLAMKQYDKGIDEAFNCTDDEIAAYYTEHKDDMTTANIVRYEFEVETDEEGELTGKDKELAEKLAAAENEDEFMAISREHLESLGGSEKQINEALNSFIGTAKVGDFSKGYVDDWLFHYDRERGDSYIYTDGNFCCVFWIMRPSGKYMFPSVNLKVVYMPKDEYKDEAALKEAVDKVYQLALKDPTTENFEKLVKEYSRDSSATYGGDYEGVVPADLNYKCEDWLFADNRKVGDIGVVEMKGNYYIMYCTGFGDPCWKTLAKRTLIDEKVTALQESIDNLVKVEQNATVITEMIFDDLATDRDRGYSVDLNSDGSVNFVKNFSLFSWFNLAVLGAVLFALGTVWFFIATAKLKKEYGFNF
ncbi:MAG: peptidylprolyl isomerase [Clostridia bacterium]|nr:peptidylprolyl isomerase [Clostridia bacterium]